MTNASSAHDGATRRLIIVGSTGSIGCQTVEVVEHLNALAQERGEPAPFRVVGLAARASAAQLLEQARLLGASAIAIAEPDDPLRSAAMAMRLQLFEGPDAAAQLVEETEADLVLNACVGAAGLGPTLAALDKGVDVAIANKESLVTAGQLVVDAALRSGAALLPVDSEHSGVWQLLPGRPVPPIPRLDGSIVRVTLTASGGPFRTWPKERIADASPDEALKHPTWSMGAKVTIDSASLTNKGLELIEAHWLFGVEADRLAAVVHPQSIVHALVEFADGSIAAQLGAPDMRCPIQIALAHPRIEEGAGRRIDLTQLGELTFEPPDVDRFPAIETAMRVIEMGGCAGAVFNAANETAVEAFLQRKIPFGRIPSLAKEALDALLGDGAQPALRSLDEALEADAQARRFVEQAVERPATATPRVTEARSRAARAS